MTDSTEPTPDAELDVDAEHHKLDELHDRIEKTREQADGDLQPGGKGGLFCHTPLVAVARNIGRKRALEMAMTGDAIDAATAADWGLINRVVPAAQLHAATLDLVHRATRGSAGSKALGKQVYYRQIGLPQDQAYQVAGHEMAEAALSPDAQEGFAAFLEKRAPRYAPR